MAIAPMGESRHHAQRVALATVHVAAVRHHAQRVVVAVRPVRLLVERVDDQHTTPTAHRVSAGIDRSSADLVKRPDA